MKISTSGSGVTIEELAGYEGLSFIIGFPAGGSKPSGFYVKMPDDGSSVTATFLRRLPLDRLLRIAAEARAEEMADAVEVASADQGRPYGGGEEHLAKVAEVFNWAVERGIPPRRAIATRWARSEATAGRWIAEARKEGALPPARPERAGRDPEGMS